MSNPFAIDNKTQGLNNYTKIPQERVKEFFEKGVTIHQDNGNYYISNEALNALGESVITAAGLKPTSTVGTGVTVEKTANNPQQGAKETSTVTTKLPAGLYDGDIPPALTEALSDVASVAADGTVTLKAGVTKDAFTKALQKYANGNAESSTLPKEVTFPEKTTDPKFVDHLVKEGALKKEDNTYVVADETKLNNLTTKIDSESGVKEERKTLNLEFMEKWLIYLLCN